MMLRCALCLEESPRLDVQTLCRECSWMDWGKPIAFAVAKQGKYKGKAVYWIMQDDPDYAQWACNEGIHEFVETMQ